MTKWLAALAFDYGVIAASIFAFEQRPGLLTGALAVLFIGCRQHGIAVLGHDGSHGSICKPAWLNDALARLCFLPFGISLARYRSFHLAHHRFVGTDRDPERKLKAGAAPAWDMPWKDVSGPGLSTGYVDDRRVAAPRFTSSLSEPCPGEIVGPGETRTHISRKNSAVPIPHSHRPTDAYARSRSTDYRVLPRRSLISLIAIPRVTRHILLLCAKDFLIWPALREVAPFMRLVASPGATLAAVAIWATIALTLGWQPVALWFAALSTSFWASNRLRIWTEHQGTNGTHRIWPTWWQRFLFLPHNIWVHPEHHANAAIPFYDLPRMRRGESLSVGELFRTFG